MNNLLSVNITGWPLYTVLSVVFWVLPLVFVPITWEVLFVFFSAAVGAKWFILASIDFISTHPDKSLTIHQFLNRQ